MNVKDFLHKMFAEVDNRTPDLAKYAAAITSVDFLFNQTWDTVVNKVAFSATSFGTGAAALFAGIGVWMSMKKESPAARPKRNKP